MVDMCAFVCKKNNQHSTCMDKIVYLFFSAQSQHGHCLDSSTKIQGNSQPSKSKREWMRLTALHGASLQPVAGHRLPESSPPCWRHSEPCTSSDPANARSADIKMLRETNCVHKQHHLERTAPLPLHISAI